MITTHGLTKRFGRVLAVDGVDLDVREGDRYGFLGPNGSGKTTTVRMVLGLVYATRGEIEVLGKPMPGRAREVLPEVGALVEGPAAYPHLSARKNLTIFDAAGPSTATASRRNRRQRVDEVLEQVGLASIGRRPVRTYSLGMRQRLGIASALLGRPRLLVLDEPTNGLDPQGIREIRELLVGLNQTGTTIFMSSHLLAEVEQLCTRVGVVDRGRLVAQAALAELRGETGRTVVRVGDPAGAVALMDGRVVGREGDRLVLADMTVAEATQRLVQARIEVHEAAPERRSLEDVVLSLTSHGSDRVDATHPRVEQVGA